MVPEFKAVYFLSQSSEQQTSKTKKTTLFLPGPMQRVPTKGLQKKCSQL